MRKITIGYVIQTYDPDKQGFVSQEFIAGDVSWENAEGESIDPPEGDPSLALEMVQPNPMIWARSALSEWLIPCRSCANIISFSSKNISQEGLKCEKCGDPIYVEDGQWSECPMGEAYAGDEERQKGIARAFKLPTAYLFAPKTLGKQAGPRKPLDNFFEFLADLHRDLLLRGQKEIHDVSGAGMNIFTKAWLGRTKAMWEQLLQASKESEVQKYRETIGNPSAMIKYIQKHGVHSEYPGHPREDWRNEVANGDTNLGYWEWVEHREEANEN